MGTLVPLRTVHNFWSCEKQERRIKKQTKSCCFVAPDGCFLRAGPWCPLADLTVLSESMSSLNKAQHLSNIPFGATLDDSLAVFVYLTLCVLVCVCWTEARPCQLSLLHLSHSLPFPQALPTSFPCL